MAEVVTMPKLGFDMAEGTLVRWVKAEGDKVARSEVIAEIETDKATVEVESSYDGIMFRHLVDEDTAVPVNAPIAVVAAEGEEPSEADIEALTGKPDKDSQKKSPKETDAKKDSADESAPAQKEAEGDVQRSEKDESAEGQNLAGGVRSSPLARRMAEEHEIEIKEVEGSGPQGRVVKKDIESYLQSLREEGKTAEADRVAEGLSPAMSFEVGEVPEDEVLSMSRLRQAIGRRMQDSNQNFPHFFLTRTYNTDALMKLRKQLNVLLPDADKLSINDFVIKAVAAALRQYPNLNTSLEDEKHIRRHGHVNIGVAVAVEDGLLTVVVKDADQKPIRLIAREVREMAQRARDGKVKPDDIEGSTFSISNLGMYGIDNFSAIINPPEAAILAVSAVQDTAVVVDGELAIGSRMKATLSADHRVTDGAEAAEFMQVLASSLEEPLRLML